MTMAVIIVMITTIIMTLRVMTDVMMTTVTRIMMMTMRSMMTKTMLMIMIVMKMAMMIRWRRIPCWYYCEVGVYTYRQVINKHLVFRLTICRS